MPQLTPIQSQVVAGLLAGKSVSAIARENSIHRSTIYHWRNEHPYFNIVLDQARSRHQVNLYDLVQDLTEQALETVATMLESVDANLRIRAAQTILRVTDPGRLPKGLRTPMEIDTMADQTLAQRAELDLAPVAHTVESDTIRQNPTVKSEPARLSRDLRSSIEFDTIADQSLAQTADVDLGTMADAPRNRAQFDRTCPTHKSGPSRNSRCACGSGLKYKRCCGNIQIACPTGCEPRFSAASPA